jgi:light-regulated signal transduction histidine kinase (bacteriophytochrome)
LVGNAIKYRGPERPNVHVDVKRRAADWLFSVQDNGIGIKLEYAEQIFGIFKRLHGSAYPGTGIGLAICERIVKSYGGQIWVESSPGEGSTFFFTLPDRLNNPA